jgi:hypothetical protein
MTQSDRDLLRDAQSKARRLIDQLVAQQQDLDRFASSQQVVLAPEKLAAGQKAFARAIESTRRTVEGIDRALAGAAASAPSPHDR